MVRVDLEPYVGPIVLRRKEPSMSGVSFIGVGGMARAIAGRAVAGGNAVELIGRDAAKAKGLAGALGGGATVGSSLLMALSERRRSPGRSQRARTS
jgi:hypothetical protein